MSCKFRFRTDSQSIPVIVHLAIFICTITITATLSEATLLLPHSELVEMIVSIVVSCQYLQGMLGLRPCMVRSTLICLNMGGSSACVDRCVMQCSQGGCLRGAVVAPLRQVELGSYCGMV